MDKGTNKKIPRGVEKRHVMARLTNLDPSDCPTSINSGEGSLKREAMGSLKKISAIAEGGNPFLQFSSDILKLFFVEQCPLQMRLICRSMREKVENYPDFDLHL